MIHVFIVIKQSEMVILTLHLNLMNKNLKKGLKSNYGKIEAKKYISTFNDIKKYLNELINPEDEEYMLVFSPTQYNFLHYFLSWYTEELMLQAEVDGDEKEFKKTVAALQEINKKVYVVFDELQRSAV